MKPWRVKVSRSEPGSSLAMTTAESQKQILRRPAPRLRSKFVERRAGARGDDREAAFDRGQDAGAGGFDGGGAVAFAAEVGEEDMTPARRGHRGEEFTGAFVGEVAMPAADALFDRPRALRVILQHLRAIIGFDHEHIGLANALLDVLRGVAEIGEPGETVRRREEVVRPVGEEKGHGVVRVMWHGKAFDLEIAESEARAGLEKLPVGAVFQPGLYGAGGGMVGEDLDRPVARQSADAGGVIAVLVCEEDGIDAFERLADGGQQLRDSPGRETGVDEHARVLGLEQGAIALTTAAEDAKPQTHGEA